MKTRKRTFDKLLEESTTSNSNVASRPYLVSLTRATTKLVYSELVATQRSLLPTATMFGVKYLTPDNELSFGTGAVYSGAVTKSDRDTITELTLANKDSFIKGQYFKINNVVYKVLTDTPFNGITETDLIDIITEAIAAPTIRTVSEAAPTSKYEGDVEISEAKFKVDKWNIDIKTRKLKTELTVELAQDMQATGFKPVDMVEDVLATQMADEINKDVLQSLVTVSSRYKVAGLTDKAVLDLTDVDVAPEQARKLYRLMCEMNSDIQKTTSYSGTYVVATARVAAVLAASGWLKANTDINSNAYGILANGLPLFCDVNSPTEYMIVGVKEDFGDNELVGSLFYAPYSEGLDLEEEEHVGEFKVIVDPSSLQPKVALLLRYGLSVNPYTVGLGEEDARNIDASDLDSMAGRSKMSSYIAVKLPKLIQ
ncbi:capsid vertex [Pseudomonas phage PspYZU05]|uniref:Capsid vertex protein n=1 Tax=Pseudomonas phage PspYZU05 TaxID=1983556 RepID=A0A2U7N2I7_9CAUD|nr:capsid vertex [Pseudomonas phage PspYZU05]ASD52090.1 capsid vertex [Pseudomonas phage PspYZU05]